MNSLGKYLAVMIAVSAMVFYTVPVCSAGEHGGKEHGGEKPAKQEHGGKEHGGEKPAKQEHGGKEHGGEKDTSGAMHEGSHSHSAEPSAYQIRQSIRDYINEVESDEDTFTIYDDETGDVRELELVRVHDRVGKTGDLYYSCTDMRDVSTGEMLDLDFDVKAMLDDLSVVDVRIHKLDGNARYTYDENDNRISL